MKRSLAQDDLFEDSDFLVDPPHPSKKQKVKTCPLDKSTGPLTQDLDKMYGPPDPILIDSESDEDDSVDSFGSFGDSFGSNSDDIGDEISEEL